MEFFFAHPQILLLVSSLLPIIFFLKYKFYKPKIYRYPLAQFLKNSNLGSQSFKRKFLNVLRVITLILLAAMIARPQWQQKLSNAKTEGIDIVLAIDVSQSMECFDDYQDPRKRIDVAKQQAQNFVEKRIDDQIGVTIFGKYAMTIAPPTLDKNMLNQVISRLQINDIDSSCTNLSEGLALAASRLKESKAKSKVVVLLTDGQPTGTTEISMERALQFAKDLNVKVYTIGVGNENGAFFKMPNGAYCQVQEAGADFQLLNKISKSTGGKTFKATNPKEIEDAYNQIDLLEKTEKKTNQYFSYHDIFWPIALAIIALMFLENFLQGFWWRGIW